MLLYQLAKVALAAAILIGQSVTAKKQCSEISVRREWRTLAPHERKEWMTAVKCLNALPHNSSMVPTFNTTYTGIPPVNKSSSYFDDWVYIHMDLNPIIHFTAHFLPWHRAYIKDFETALRQKCGFKGAAPYWNWTLEASNFTGSYFWDNSTSGIGGWGDPDNDYTITTGGFANAFSVSYPSPHQLRRHFYPTRPTDPDLQMVTLITPESQKALVNGHVGDFIGFQGSFESGGSHGAIHRLVGGDLFGECPVNAPPDCIPGPKWSSNDPIFMLHHGMIDKLWHDWQHAHPANFWSFDGGATAVVNDSIPDPAWLNGAPPFVRFSTPIPTDGIMNNYTIYELMDTKNERLCYTYE